MNTSEAAQVIRQGFMAVAEIGAWDGQVTTRGLTLTLTLPDGSGATWRFQVYVTGGQDHYRYSHATRDLAGEPYREIATATLSDLDSIRKMVRRIMSEVLS